MWKLNPAPIKLIMYIVTPPKMEFKTNLSTFFIGKIKILPNINKKHIHAKYVSILTFIKFHFLYYKIKLLSIKSNYITFEKSALKVIFARNS